MSSQLPPTKPVSRSSPSVVVRSAVGWLGPLALRRPTCSGLQCQARTCVRVNVVCGSATLDGFDPPSGTEPDGASAWEAASLERSVPRPRDEPPPALLDGGPGGMELGGDSEGGRGAHDSSPYADSQAGRASKRWASMFKSSSARSREADR